MFYYYYYYRTEYKHFIIEFCAAGSCNVVCSATVYHFMIYLLCLLCASSCVFSCINSTSHQSWSSFTSHRMSCHKHTKEILCFHWNSFWPFWNDKVHKAKCIQWMTLILQSNALDVSSIWEEILFFRIYCIFPSRLQCIVWTKCVWVCVWTKVKSIDIRRYVVDIKLHIKSLSFILININGEWSRFHRERTFLNFLPCSNLDKRNTKMVNGHEDGDAVLLILKLRHNFVDICWSFSFFAKLIYGEIFLPTELKWHCTLRCTLLHYLYPLNCAVHFAVRTANK